VQVFELDEASLLSGEGVEVGHDVVDGGGKALWQMACVQLFSKMSQSYGVVSTGWPDWANFRSLGDCLLWAVY
jgi:hypothetical protein